MFKKSLMIATLVIGLGLGGQALAHTPLCSCYDNGDGTITCEGGFSDGSSAAGVEMRVVDEGGKVLSEGKMDDLGEFTFDKPAAPFKVQFDAGPGHLIEINGKDIAQ